MNKKTELVICLGSSCFARGNKNLLPVIQSFIKENSFEEKVDFRGTHCCGKCIKGPVLKMDEIYYVQLNEKILMEILHSNLT
jgi:NADH:ubiquinone oxidoreductase subunit E